MPRLEPHDVSFFESPEALRAWLDANHATATEKWVGMRRKASGSPSITWEQVVDEVLCYGWIDGVRMPADDGSCIRITPRRAGSNWSARNVGRVEVLRAAGRMRPDGEAAFARRGPEPAAGYSFETRLEFDDPAVDALRADADAWAFWEAQPPGYRRTGAHWVMSAKREETRNRRLAALIDASRRRERLGQLTGNARAPRTEA